MAGTNRISAAERNENGTKRGSLRASAFMLALLLIFTTVASVVPITLTTVTAAAPQLVAASLDSFKINGSATSMPSSRTVDGTTSTVSTLGFRGWIGFNGETITQIGYKINNGSPQWVNGGLLATEQAVLNAGGQQARRYEISVPVSTLRGTNSIVAVVEVGGQVVEINEALIATATNGDWSPNNGCAATNVTIIQPSGTSATQLFGGNTNDPTGYNDITTQNNSKYFFPSQGGLDYLKTHSAFASNYLIFRYGPYGENGANIFQLGATGVYNSTTGQWENRPNGVFPGDPEFPDPDGQGSLARVCTLNEGTTIMEIIEAAYKTSGTNGQIWYTSNFSGAVSHYGWVPGDYNLSGGIKFIMNATYSIDDTNLAHNAALSICTPPGGYREAAGVSVGLTNTDGSTEYWRSYPSGFGTHNGWQPVTIQRGTGVDANEDGVPDGFDAPLIHIENSANKNVNWFYGVTIDNCSSNASSRVDDGSDDSLAGNVSPIAVEIEGSPALLRMECGSRITDSSVSTGGNYYGTGVKLISGGRVELFGQGDDANYGDAKIEHMAVGVEQINGKTSIKTSYTGYNDNEISIALTHGQSIGKWIDSISSQMLIKLWLRNVEQWHSGDIVMDTGRNNTNNNGYKEYAVPVTDGDRARLYFQNADAIHNYNTEMGLEYYTGLYDPNATYQPGLVNGHWIVNQNHTDVGNYPLPYPVIRFYVGTVYNTRTHLWYRNLYDAVNCIDPVILQGTTAPEPDPAIQDGDVLVFYGNTVEDKDVVIPYNLTIRSPYTGELLASGGGYDSRRAPSSQNYTAKFEGDHKIIIESGKTVTFGGNATTETGTVSGSPNMLTIDGNNTATNMITNNGTLNLKDHITLTKAADYAVKQNGEEHLYAGALFSNNGTADHFLVSSGNYSGNHYITLETRTPNGGNNITVALGAENTQYAGRDVVVAGTTDNIGSTLSDTYLQKFPLVDLGQDYKYVYTQNGGVDPAANTRVLELQIKDAILVHLYKYDQDGNPLAGAGFTLYKVENGQQTAYAIAGESNPHITDANGFVQISVREGSYVLKETGVPNGYTGDSGALSGLSFTVTSDNLGNLSLTGTGFTLVAGTDNTYRVNVTNTLKTIDIPVVKNWSGTSSRPSVTVTLIADGVNTGITKVLSSSNSWTQTFTGVPEYNTSTGNRIVYTVEELFTGMSGYTVSYSPTGGVTGASANKTITITNTRKTTSITVNKTWDDSSNQDGKRGTVNAQVTLYQSIDNGTTWTQVSGAVWNVPVTNAPSTTWSNLPEYDDAGNLITYAVTETMAASSGYTSAATNTKVVIAHGGTGTITNSYTPEVISIPVTKTWADNNNQFNNRPATITIRLQKENGTNNWGDVASQTLTVTNANTLSYTFANVAKYQNGSAINYRVREDAISAYTTTYGGTAAAGFTVTNTLKTIDIPVVKNWDGVANPPVSSVTVELYRGGQATGLTQVLSSSNNWTATFTDQPEYNVSTNARYTYTVVEQAFQGSVGFTTTYSPANGVTGANADKTITVTNTQKTIDIPVVKVWSGVTNPPVNSITVELYRDGQATGITRTLSASTWTATFTGQPEYDASGVRYRYTVVEQAFTGSDGYNTTYSPVNGVTGADSNKTITVTNARKTASLTITKLITGDLSALPSGATLRFTVTDADGNSQYVNYPADFTGGVATVSGVVTGECTITEAITGTAVTGYTRTTTNNGTPSSNGGLTGKVTVTTSGGAITFTNNYSRDKGTLKITKSVTGDLTAADLAGKSIKFTITGPDSYSEVKYYPADFTNGVLTLTGLPTGSYSVVEDQSTAQVNNYTLTVSDSGSTTVTSGGTANYTVINNYTRQTASLTITKIINDDSTYPCGITYQNITFTVKNSANQTWTATNNGDGTWTVADLPLGEYTVTESMMVPSGYTCVTTVNGSSTTNTVINSSNVTVNGTVTVGASGGSITFTNAYTRNTGTLIIRKVVNGEQVMPSTAVFTLSDAPYSNLKGEEHYYSEFVTVNGQTYKQLTLPNMPTGTYRVSETRAEVTGYTLETIWDNNTSTGQGSVTNGGTTILICTNTYTRILVDVTVTKIWNDANDQDGIRPDNLTLTLNGVPTGFTVPTPTVTKSGNNWTYTWSGVPQYDNNGTLIAYTVTENTVPQGYECNSVMPVAAGGLIYNSHTPETIDVTVTKAWNDNSNQDGKRPSSLTLTLNNVPNGVTVPTPTVVENGDSWTYTWTGLPKYSNGQEITYTVTETNVPEGYTCATTTVNAGGTITNSYTPETIDVTVTKAWNDNSNQDGKRPADLALTLNGLPNGVTAPTPTVVKNGNSWTYTWTGLPKYNNGTLINYTVTEGTVPTDYTCATTTVSAGGTITNVHVPEVTSVTVSKVWDDNNNQDGKRPASVSIQLYANNAASGQAVSVSGDTWTYTWSGLPKYSNGQEIAYTVGEPVVPSGYTLEGITGTAATGFTVTNKHVPEVTSVTVSKVWNDNNNLYGLRPSSVSIQLYANNAASGQAVSVSGDTWSYTWSGLPKYSNGQEIAYTVDETSVPEGYTLTEITGSAATGFNVVNTLQTVKVKFVKTDNSAANPGMLSGAVFTVVSSTGNCVSGPLTSGTNGILANASDVSEFTVPYGGSVVLTETDAPDGYMLMSGSVTVSVSLTGSVTVTNAGNPALDNGVYTIAISNTPGVVLPATGGIGTVPFTVIGLSLMIVSAGLLVYVRKKENA